MKNWLRISGHVGALGLLFFALGLEAHAQEKGQVAQLPEVVVTASPIIEGNEVNRLGSQVTVVNQEQIEDLNAQDLPSALRRVPGVVISRHNPVGSFGGGEGGSIFIRGQGSSRPGAEIGMAVDGITKFVSIWTHPLMDVISVDNIASIDVYKGAQPVLFGNMASAVVDVHTKRMTEEGFTTKVQGAYGSYDTLVEVLEHGGKIKNFDYYLVQSLRRSDGHRENADGELQNYFGRVGYQPSKNWDVNVLVTHSDNYADDPGRVDRLVAADGRFKTRDYFSVGTLSNRYDWGEGYLKVYEEKGNIDWVDQQGTPGLDTLTDYRNYGVKFRETFKPWSGGEILAGVDLDYISGEVDVLSPSAPERHFPKETFRILGPHIALSQLIGTKEAFYAIPSAGLRYLDHSQFESETAPQYGLILGYRDTQIHGSYARGVNYPGIFVKAQDDLFLPGVNKWETLRPELVDHYEVGISHVFTKKLKADFTWFYNDGSDRIVISPPPPFPPVFKNIGDYTTKGVEGTVTFSPLPELSLFAGFTYLEAEPKDLPYSPEWTASVGANYRFLEKFMISVDGLYVDEQFVTSRGRTTTAVNTEKVGSYFLLNAKLTYDFRIPSWHLDCTAFVAGENLTDTEYEQKKSYPMPGINGMAGVTVRF